MSDTIKGFRGKDGPIRLDYSGVANVPGAIQSIGALTAQPGDHFEVETVDSTGRVATVKAVEKPGGGSGQNVNLTAAQVNALDGMFRVCAYVKGDVSPEYNAFRVAFGLDSSGGDPGGDEDMPGNNNTVLLSNVDTANPGEIYIAITKDAMPSLLAYGFNAETKETGLGGKHITGITVKCKTAGTITIGKVDMRNYKAGVAPVMIGEKAFEIADGMNELDVDFALSETETIGFQIPTDTGKVAFGPDDDEIVDEMYIMPGDQYRKGINKRFRLYGSIYGGDI